MLENYNDNRSKSYYCLAVTLLKIDNITKITEYINENKNTINITNIKEIINEFANAENIELKLKK